MKRVPMTINGEQLLRDELHRRKYIERPRIIKAVAEARAHGDLKENAEYHAAREQHGFNEARIRDIESKLSYAQVIDVTKLENTGRVIFGATVNVINNSTDIEVRYHIVGEDEADIKQNKISVTSPIASALIGKTIDDIVEVKTPNGIVKYSICDVEYKAS